MRVVGSASVPIGHVGIHGRKVGDLFPFDQYGFTALIIEEAPPKDIEKLVERGLNPADYAFVNDTLCDNTDYCDPMPIVTLTTSEQSLLAVPANVAEAKELISKTVGTIREMGINIFPFTNRGFKTILRLPVMCVGVSEIKKDLAQSVEDALRILRSDLIHKRDKINEVISNIKSD